MSVYENTMKMYQRIAPDMKFADAHRLSEEAQQNSTDHSQKNYAMLLFLEMIGVDDSGYFPKEFLEKGSVNQKYAWAIMELGRLHGAHSCGIPGMDISKEQYYQKFIRGNGTTEFNISQEQKRWKEQLQKQKV